MIEIGTIEISIFIGFILGYFTSYFNEKGKNITRNYNYCLRNSKEINILANLI